MAGFALMGGCLLAEDGGWMIGACSSDNEMEHSLCGNSTDVAPHAKWHQVELQQQTTASLPTACKLPPMDDVDMWGATTGENTNAAASSSSSSSSSDSLDVDCLIDGVIAAELSLSLSASSSCQAGCGGLDLLPHLSTAVATRPPAQQQQQQAASSSSGSSACRLPAMHVVALQQQQHPASHTTDSSRAYDDAWQRLCYYGPASAEQQQWLAQLQCDRSRLAASPFAARAYAPL